MRLIPEMSGLNFRVAVGAGGTVGGVELESFLGYLLSEATEQGYIFNSVNSLAIRGLLRSFDDEELFIETESRDCILSPIGTRLLISFFPTDSIQDAVNEFNYNEFPLGVNLGTVTGISFSPSEWGTVNPYTFKGVRMISSKYLAAAISLYSPHSVKETSLLDLMIDGKWRTGIQVEKTGYAGKDGRRINHTWIPVKMLVELLPDLPEEVRKGIAGDIRYFECPEGKVLFSSAE